MSQLFAVGRMTANLELKTSVKNNPYLRFSLAEQIGRGEEAHTQYIQVWAWGAQAHQLIRSGAGKGCLLWVSGSLELEEYTKSDGVTRDKQLKLKLKDWGFALTNGRRTQNAGKTEGETAVPCGGPGTAGVIDGERDALPE